MGIFRPGLCAARWLAGWRLDWHVKTASSADGDPSPSLSVALHPWIDRNRQGNSPEREIRRIALCGTGKAVLEVKACRKEGSQN